MELRSLFRQTKITKSLKKEFIQTFQENPSHHWIVKSPFLKKIFLEFFDTWTETTFANYRGRKIHFTLLNGKLACAFRSQPNEDVVLIFPELFKLLSSYKYEHGLAIISHEIGHIVLKHNEREITTLDAQVEADFFAAELGYGEELQEVLLEQNQSIDTKVRISRLSLWYFNQSSN